MAFFKEIFQIADSTDLRDAKYIFKLDYVIFEFFLDVTALDK